MCFFVGTLTTTYRCNAQVIVQNSVKLSWSLCLIHVHNLFLCADHFELWSEWIFTLANYLLHHFVSIGYLTPIRYSIQLGGSYVRQIESPTIWSSDKWLLHIAHWLWLLVFLVERSQKHGIPAHNLCIKLSSLFGDSGLCVWFCLEYTLNFDDTSTS